MLTATEHDDARYRELLLSRIRVSLNYRPTFGTARDDEEITSMRFTQLFSADPLYHWLGLDSPLVYAAHKAAGGMTSIYRQIGVGCEHLIRRVFQDALNLSDQQVRWGYNSTRSDGREQGLALDARIDTSHLRDRDASERVRDWLARSSRSIGQHRDTTGAVFEVRQGYKSADTKRQNADLRFGLAAYDAGYLPVILVVSTQVNTRVIDRYRQDKLLVLTGTLTGDDTTSTFAFFESVVGYSLRAFFEHNAVPIRAELTTVLERLLTTA